MSQPQARISILRQDETEKQAAADLSSSGPRRTILAAVPLVTHSAMDKIGFIPTLFGIVRDAGESGYVDEGAPTRELLGWESTHAGLIADLDSGHSGTPTWCAIKSRVSGQCRVVRPCFVY